MRTVIIDDEPHNIDNLALLLNQYCPMVQIVATALNATDGIEVIRTTKPELVFLDIQMPGKNGFDLLRSLDHYNFSVIFVTAFDKFGIQAIKFSALDYLLKPVDVTELKAAVQKAMDKHAERTQNLRLENLLNFVKQEQEYKDHRIALQTNKETRFVQVRNIIRCESSNNYTTFFLNGGEKILTSKPIFEYEDMLSSYGFFRSHQSHLVNKTYLRSFIKQDGGYLMMEDGSHVPVARNRRETVKALFSR